MIEACLKQLLRGKNLSEIERLTGITRQALSKMYRGDGEFLYDKKSGAIYIKTGYVLPIDILLSESTDR